MKAMIDEATKADKSLVDPLLQFRNYGVQLPHHWSTVSNGAAFGTDYFTRTAVGKSNIFVNKQNETKYFYQDLDQTGARLNGAKKYTVTYAPCAVSGRSRSTTRTISFRRTTSNATRSERRTRR